MKTLFEFNSVSPEPFFLTPPERKALRTPSESRNAATVGMSQVLLLDSASLCIVGISMCAANTTIMALGTLDKCSATVKNIRKTDVALQSMVGMDRKWEPLSEEPTLN